MSAKVFVDTNVFGYLFDADAPRKKQAASDVLAKLAEENRLVLSTQVLQELYVTVTRKLAAPLAQDQASRILQELANFPVVGIEAPLVLRSVSLSRRHQVSLWDALIIEAAVVGECQTVLTEDLQDGWEVRGLRVENPFAEID